jgi:predicted aspartyl protease
MRNTITNFSICGSLMIVAAALPCNARSLPAPDGSIRLNTLSGIPVVDRVFLNGNGPYRFLLDTGAQTNQVDASIARKLGLARAFQVAMVTTAGTIQVAGGRVAEVSLGPAAASNQEFLFTTLDGAHALSGEIQGVLGEQFLAHFDYLLDFAHHRVVFGEPAPEGGNRVGFETINGCPAIETSEGKLTLDSGANLMVLYRTAASKSAGPYSPTIRTAAGTASVSAIQGVRLRIAGREYHPASAVASLRTALLGDDGILPASLFHAVFVGNSGKYVILDPSADSGAAGQR